MRKKLLYIGGFISLLYVIVHASFWKLFNWNEELARLSTMNKGLMIMLDIGIGYLFVFATIISVYLAKLKNWNFLRKRSLFSLQAYIYYALHSDSLFSASPCWK